MQLFRCVVGIYCQTAGKSDYGRSEVFLHASNRKFLSLDGVDQDLCPLCAYRGGMQIVAQLADLRQQILQCL